jgi:hypothetical protein
MNNTTLENFISAIESYIITDDNTPIADESFVTLFKSPIISIVNKLRGKVDTSKLNRTINSNISNNTHNKKTKIIKTIDITTKISNNWNDIIAYIKSKGYRMLSEGDTSDYSFIRQLKEQAWSTNYPTFSLTISSKTDNEKRYELIFVKSSFMGDEVVLASIPIVKIDRTQEKESNSYFIYTLDVHGSTPDELSLRNIEILGNYSLNKKS